VIVQIDQTTKKSRQLSRAAVDYLTSLTGPQTADTPG
jgi:hypothetical protein